MSEVWNTLELVKEQLIEKFEETGYEVFEPGMDRFNQPGWVNRVWSSDSYRRAHVDVVDARESKGLWMMHCCIFPRLDNNGPIFGLDVIAGKKKITGFFHDFSPTVESNHQMIYQFGERVNRLEWNKSRELPDWARAIFTEHMVAAGNINSNTELEQIVELSQNSIVEYLESIGDFNWEADTDEVKKAQNRYAHYQKQNPHTPKTMTSLGLNEDDVKIFIQDCLFPDIN